MTHDLSLFLSPVPDFELARPVLSPEQVRRIAAYGTSEDTRQGQILYHAGQPSAELIVLETGTIDIYRPAIRDLPDYPVITYGPGRFAGEFSLFSGQTLFLTARMTDPGRIHRITPDRFRQLMADDCELSDILLRALLARRKINLVSEVARAIEIIGTGSDSCSHELRTYAARQLLPHTWLDVAEQEGGALLEVYGLTSADLPVVIVNGEPLRRVTPAVLAERIGLSYRGGIGRIDLAVIGGGPAGLAAAVYGASEGLSTVLFDAVGIGGQAAATSRIENYLGFPFGLSGAQLTELGQVQAVKFGARLSSPCRVTRLDASGTDIQLTTSDDTRITARAVILATGAHYRRLSIERWNDFEGAGIYYAATELEARSCQGNPVTVIGGANSAGQAALFLAAKGCDVTVAIRSDPAGTMSSYLVDRLRDHFRVTIRTDTEVIGLHGRTSLRAVTLRHRGTGEVTEQPCRGLFCFIGAEPATSWLTDVALADDGFIRTDGDIKTEELGTEWALLNRRPLPYETNVPRVFAAGDVRYGSMKRVAASVGEGSSAVGSVHAALRRITV